MKILITGAAGFLGKKLITILSKDKAVTLIPTDRVGNKVEKMDITDKEEVMCVFAAHKPDVAIHCAAMSDVDGCEDQKERAMAINRDGTANVVEACNAADALLVHISTDFVFDGRKGGYAEEDKPHPLSYYAKTKYEGEKRVRNRSSKWMVVRPEVLYGYNGDGSERSFTIWVYDSLKAGKNIRVVDDQFNTPTLIDDIAIAIGKLIKKDARGIWHVAGPDRLSRYGMAVILADEFKYDKRLIIPIKTSELRQKALRPQDSSLNTEKLKRAGILMHKFREGVRIMKGQMEKKV